MIMIVIASLTVILIVIIIAMSFSLHYYSSELKLLCVSSSDAASEMATLQFRRAVMVKVEVTC